VIRPFRQTPYDRRLTAPLALAAIALVSGCGKAGMGRATFPVTGVVTMGGKPVEGALVQFTPAAGEAGFAGAQTQTDAEGAFDVSVMLEGGKESQRGLPAGEYRVSVTKMEYAGAAAIDRPPKNVLPAKYQSAESTPLTATVTADGENHFEFPL
jgi:hypothetical protein